MEKQFDTFSASVLPVPGTLVLPGTTISLKNLGRADVHRLQEDLFVAIPVKSDHDKEYKESDYHKYGVTAKVTAVKEEKNAWTLTAICQDRVLVSKVFAGRFPVCTCELAPETNDLNETSTSDMLTYIKDTVRQMAGSFRGGEHIFRIADSYEDLNQLITYLAQYMQLAGSERYELLEKTSMKERCLLFIDLLLRQKEMLALNLEMNEKFSREASEYYRQQALRRQIEALKKQLGETEAEEKEEDSWHARIDRTGAPESVRNVLKEEADKLDQSSQGAEQENLRTWLEFALSLPWMREPVHFADLTEARKILDSRHYGMDKVKDRIIEHLAVMKLRKSNKGSAILLVGPPGTGKTSLGKSVARALDREYVRMSLGGIRDESEVRGHRRTYIGSMAGRVLQSMKRAGKTNPVMVLDELDKLMQGGFSGDPAAAMLEVLDPEQNDTFTDHYLDLPYDLSDVFFIATANSLDSIPGPLLDRMEVIEIPSYTSAEKVRIAADHLIPEVLQDHGIPAGRLVITPEAIDSIVDDYTMEAGCRGLKKRIAAIARKKSVQLTETEETVTVDACGLEDILGIHKVRHDRAQESNPAGVVTGLAWTAVGGEVLFIETTDMPGTGQLILTGQLGDVMKESARISLSVLKSRLPLDTLYLKERDIHIHFPAGATPKDGPSAGITMFTALASLATKRPVDSRIAMTGELSLRGDVLPIGGLREKLYGAMRAGIRKVLIPWDNRQDLKEVAPAVLDSLEIIPVKTVEEVLQHTLGIHLPVMEQKGFSGITIELA